jgi:hypothetical protein
VHFPYEKKSLLPIGGEGATCRCYGFDSVSCEPITIDCYGHSSSTSLDVVCSGVPVQFKFADQKSVGLRGHAGLYVDYTATIGRDYLRYPRSRRVALLCEPNASIPFVDHPELSERFALVMTHDTRLLQRGLPFVEVPFGTSFLEGILDEARVFSKSKLISMIGAPHPNPKAGHILRNEVIEVLASRSDVDRFGKGVKWIDSKLDGLADYAFSIAMENCSRDFYFTEKIIDCLVTNTVPIYCGCRGIDRYFDPRGLLIFETLSELLQILDNLSWSKYVEMLPYVQKNREKAIDAGWATRSQLFERVGNEVLKSLGPFKKRSEVPVFRRVQDIWRKVVGTIGR